MTPRQHVEAHAKVCRKAIEHGQTRPKYTGPSLCGIDLTGAVLNGANLSVVDLSGARIINTYLTGANLMGANLSGVDLMGSDLMGSDLSGATMPDGRTFEEYKEDPLAGICSEPDARKRAIAAWGNHTWDDCPLHEAHGWDSIEAAPKAKRILVTAFITLFDCMLLPKPKLNLPQNLGDLILEIE